MHLSQFSCRIDWFRITFASADGMYENAPCFYINKLSAVKLLYVRLSMHLQATRCQAAVQQKNKAVDKHFKKRNRDLLFGDADGETEAERLKEDVSMLRAQNAKLMESTNGAFPSIVSTELRWKFCDADPRPL